MTEVKVCMECRHTIEVHSVGCLYSRVNCARCGSEPADTAVTWSCPDCGHSVHVGGVGSSRSSVFCVDCGERYR